MKKQFFLIISLLSLIILMGCPQQQAPAQVTLREGAALVPANSSSYVFVDMKTLISDPEFSDAIGGSAKINTQLADFRDGLGIEPRDLRSTLVFFDSSGMYGTMIITSAYDKGRVTLAFRNVSNATGVRETVFSDVSLLEAGDAEGATSIAFLKPDVLVVGKPQAVRDVVLVSQGKLARFSDPNVDKALATVRTDAVMLIVSRVSENDRKVAFDPISKTVQAVVTSIARNGTNMEMTLIMTFPDQGSALEAKNQMDLLVTFVKASAEEGSIDSNYAATISRMETKTEGEILTSTLLVTPEELKSLESESGNPFSK